jgi:Family of unknown function (DUF5677)
VLYWLGGGFVTEKYPNKKILLERQRLLNLTLGHYRHLMRLMLSPVSKRLPDDRIEILACSVVKAIRNIDVSQLLFRGLYTEEMSVLIRTLAEMVINSAYLQIADDNEVKRFYNFDRVAINTTVTRYHRVAGDGETIPETLTESIGQKASAALIAGGLRLSDTEWSQKNVFQRASAVDQSRGNDSFKKFTNSIYQHGHIYTHSTYFSLVFYREMLRTGVAPMDESRMQQGNNLLFGVGTCVSTLARFMNDHFALSYDRMIVDLTFKLDEAVKHGKLKSQSSDDDGTYD